MKLFLQKNAKFSRVGAPPPDLRASGGDPKTAPPLCEFLATRLFVIMYSEARFEGRN